MRDNVTMIGTYQYRFIDSQGKKRSGQLAALSLREAKEKLHAQGVFVLSLKKRRSSLSFFRKKEAGLSREQLNIFTTQLAHLLSAGVPLYESLLSLEEQYNNERFHTIISSLCEQIKAGSSLSRAMRSFPASFDRLYTSMVAAGESVGLLDKTLEKLASFLQKQNRLRKQILTAMIYPLILLTFSFALIAVLLTFVVPSLEALFADQYVNRFTRFVFGISHFVTKGWMYYIPIVSGLIISLFFGFRSDKWKRSFRLQLLKTPIVRDCIVQTSLARFARTMGTLLEGGVTIIQALQISRHVMKQPILEEVVIQAEKQIIEGSLLSRELAKSPWIPPLVPRMLAIGEEGGNTSLMLTKIAELYEEEVEKTTTRLTALAQPVILLMLGGVVGFIMMAILLPLTDVSGFMGG
ncbi:MAG: type II secretion system F family protein, partial [Chlamydiales bacterium]